MTLQLNLGPVYALALLVAAAPCVMASATVSRGPIHIDGDIEFTPANGVIGGQGTLENPYRIEGWLIDESGPVDVIAGDAGVHIENTAAHFVIRNVTIQGQDRLDIGILFEAVQNGLVTDVAVRTFRHPVMLDHVESVTFSTTVLEMGSVNPLLGGGSGDSAFVVSESRDVTIRETRALGPVPFESIRGFQIQGSQDVEFHRNIFDGAVRPFGTPLDVESSSDIRLFENFWSGQECNGLRARSVARLSVSRDNFEDSGFQCHAAISLESATDVLITGTHWRGNGRGLPARGAISIEGTRITVVDNHMEGNNFDRGSIVAKGSMLQGSRNVLLDGATIGLYAKDDARADSNRFEGGHVPGNALGVTGRTIVVSNNVWANFTGGALYAEGEEVILQGGSARGIQHLQDPREAIVSLQGKNIRVQDFQMRDNVGNGMRASADMAIVLRRVELAGHQGNGALLENANSILVEDCKVTANTGYGLKLSSMTKPIGATVSRCDLSGNGENLVEALAAGSDVKVNAASLDFGAAFAALLLAVVSARLGRR